MHKKSGGLGSKSAFCGACVKLDGMSASTLRRKIASGEIVLEGFCLNRNREAPSTTMEPSIQRRGSAVTRFVAGATGKMNAERSKPSKIKSKKRRKSVEEAKRAEGVLKRETLKQLQGKEPKHGLLRRTVAYIAGKENIVMKRKANPIVPKKVSKATKYRHVQAGAAVINGASRIFDQQDPNTFRAEAMQACLKTTLDPPMPQTANEENTETAGVVAVTFGNAMTKQKIEDDKLELTRLKMCTKFIESLKDLEDRPEARRPYLACFSSCKRPDVERLCNMKISKYEFTKARLHALYPGPLKEEPKIAMSRQRIKTTTLQRFMEFMERPGILQRYI